MRWFFLLLPLLAGCDSGKQFTLGDRSCQVNYTNWTGGVTYHILQGRGDGSFDYDPAGDVQQRIEGRYVLANGNFSWNVRYNDDHYRERTEVDGYGFAKQTGDLDVEYTTTTTDILGDVFEWATREERIGCDVTRRIDYGEAVSWHYGTYKADRYEYVDEDWNDGYPWVVEATINSDLTYSESVVYSGSDWTYDYTETGDGTGYSNRDWYQTFDDPDGLVTYDGYYENWLDGSRHTHYDGAQAGDTWTWDYTLDYAGTGSGTYTTPSANCTLTFVEGNCTYDCGGGSTGDC